MHNVRPLFLLACFLISPTAAAEGNGVSGGGWLELQDLQKFRRLAVGRLKVMDERWRFPADLPDEIIELLTKENFQWLAQDLAPLRTDLVIADHPNPSGKCAETDLEPNATIYFWPEYCKVQGYLDRESIIELLYNEGYHHLGYGNQKSSLAAEAIATAYKFGPPVSNRWQGRFEGNDKFMTIGRLVSTTDPERFEGLYIRTNLMYRGAKSEYVETTNLDFKTGKISALGSYSFPCRYLSGYWVVSSTCTNNYKITVTFSHDYRAAHVFYSEAGYTNFTFRMDMHLDGEMPPAPQESLWEWIEYGYPPAESYLYSEEKIWTYILTGDQK